VPAPIPSDVSKTLDDESITMSFSFLNIKAFNEGQFLKVAIFVEIFVKSGKSIFSKS
jgi:hypothetical protein